MWKEKPLAGCVEALIDYRGKTPEKSTSGVPLITAKVVKNGTIQEPDEYIDPNVYDEWMRRGIPKPGDVVLTTEAPLGEVARLSERRVALAQRVVVLRGLSDTLDNGFLKYFLQSKPGQERLQQRSSGTTVMGIRQAELRKVKIPLPPFSLQKAIASILGALDDKIDLNSRMNGTLESMARALYKSWFVDFDPVVAKAAGKRPFGMDDATAALFPDRFVDSELGPIPEGWASGKICDVCTVLRTSVAPAQHIGKLFSHYSIPAFDSGKTPVAELGEEIKSNKYVVPGDSVLLSKLNPETPRVWMPDIADDVLSVCSTEFLVCRPITPWTRPVLYCLFTSTSFQFEFASLVGGTSKSHQRVKPPDFQALKVQLPNEALIKEFDRRTKNLFELQASNHKESQTLAQLRDLLLPKLISGEIRVKDAEKVVGEAV